MNPRSTGAILAALLACASPVRADDAEAAALALFDEGRRLMKEGAYADACPKLAESQRLDPGMGTLFNLSHCYEQLGLTASAWKGFREVAARARAEGMAQRERSARDRAKALEGRLTRLLIRVHSPAPGLSVERNGELVGAAQWGVALPVDPGEYTIVASAPGFVSEKRRVIVDGAGTTTSVDLPKLTKAPATARPAPARDPGRRSESAAPNPRQPGPRDDGAPKRTSWHAPVAIASWIGGGVLLLASTGMALRARAIANDADCDANDRCSPDGAARRDDAVKLGNWATVVGGAGVVAAGAGVAIWLTQPNDEVALSIAPHLGGVTLYGQL